MILQALKEYYDRIAKNNDSKIAPEGFEKKPLEFLIIIDEKGEFINIEDTREKVGKKLAGKSFVLPRSKGRSGSKSYATTFLLWDHIGYVLGLPDSDEKSLRQHQTWVDMLESLSEELSQDVGIKAIRRFYQTGGVQKAQNCTLIQDCLKSIPCNMSFRLVSELNPVPCSKKVREFVEKSLLEKEDGGVPGKFGVCLVTGETGEIARTHGRTPINKDTKNLIGFQKNSGYDSYGKEQGYNAPIIKSSEFAYVTGLNTLLKSGKQRMQVGDASTVFWSEKQTEFESEFSSYFSEPPKDNPAYLTEKIRGLLTAVNSGKFMEDEGNTKFYILGLSPNSARISVRFWHHGTVGEFAEKICQHFRDLEIVKPPGEPEHYSLWRLLVNISSQDKSENIPPSLAGEFMRSILTNTPYPASILQAALRRIRSDTERRVKPSRAALIKGYLNRFYRQNISNNYKELKVSLDKDQPSIGYQLGRLFATLAKIQEEAQGNINTSIKERFYGAACSSPVTVFANLLRLKTHHLAKLSNPGRKVYFEKLLGEIMSHYFDFPAHLDLHEQGRFAIGYYHQWQDFYSRNDNDEKQIQVEEE